MKNIIYQYWQGEMKPGVIESTRLIKEYANKIGAEYRFDHNITIAGKTVNVPIYYEPANPLVDDSFDAYDNVALVDIDVFPVDGLNDNMFDLLDGDDAGICTEPKQPSLQRQSITRVVLLVQLIKNGFLSYVKMTLGRTSYTLLDSKE